MSSKSALPKSATKVIEKLREAQQRQWREENREATAAYNQHVEKHGVFSDGNRSF